MKLHSVCNRTRLGNLAQKGVSKMRGKFNPYSPNTFRFLRLIYHLPNFAKLFWRLFQDPRVPIYRKAIPMVFGAIAVMLATVYIIVLKLDIIPDVFPIIGFMDDIIISVILIFGPGAWIFIRVCPRDIVLEHVEQINR